jgi:hypothetical protein
MSQYTRNARSAHPKVLTSVADLLQNPVRADSPQTHQTARRSRLVAGPACDVVFATASLAAGRALALEVAERQGCSHPLMRVVWAACPSCSTAWQGPRMRLSSALICHFGPTSVEMRD